MIGKSEYTKVTSLYVGWIPVSHGPREFKVTFIYRKFINSYTDKFIILERDIYIYV